MSTVLSSSSSSLLIPGLPNDIASRILSTIPFAHHVPLKQTCKSWHHFFSSQTIIPLRHHLSNISHLICLFPGDPSTTPPVLFDAHSLAWRSLPLMPSTPNTRGRSNFSALFLSPHLYVLGGTVSTTHDQLASSSSAFRFDFITGSWQSISPMLSPRGSFACAAIAGGIVVAGGWLQGTEFGRRMRSTERYDVVKEEWEVLEELPEDRAGCVGFVVKEKREFWVMGGDMESMNGVFSREVYCKDGVVMDLEKGKWNMQRDDRIVRTGRIAVVQNDEDSGFFGIFMLHESEILRYDMASNSWLNETTLPTKVPNNPASVSFIALGKELLVMTLLRPYDPEDNWSSRRVKRIQTLHIQIYHPMKRTWRSLQINPSFTCGLNFRTAVTCIVQL